MRNTASIIASPLLLTLLLSSNIKAETEISIEPSLLYFHYTEFSTSSTVLDKETGWLPGIQVHIIKRLSEKWETKFELTTYSGDIDYDGQTQGGTPHSTTTYENILRLGIDLQTPLATQTNLVFGARHNEWKRNIHDNNGVSGLLEIYRWWEISAGLTHKFLKTDSQFWYAEAHLLRTINPVIHVDLSRADLGKTDLNLGSDWGTRLKLSWTQENASNLQYSIGAFYEAWNFGRSNTKATTGGTYTGNFTEPYSETRNTGLIFEITKTY